MPYLALDPCKRKISRLDTVTIPLLTCVRARTGCMLPGVNAGACPFPASAAHTDYQENGNE